MQYVAEEKLNDRLSLMTVPSVKKISDIKYSREKISLLPYKKHDQDMAGTYHVINITYYHKYE